MLNNFFTSIFLIVIFSVITCGQSTTSVDSASAHLQDQMNQYHTGAFVYVDDNAGGNIFTPSIYEGEYNHVSVDQAVTSNPYAGRSCLKLVLTPQSTFADVNFVYPDKNIGKLTGYNLSGATQLSFFARGSGTVEFLLGGQNRPPFYNDTLPKSDGVDLRSSGFIKLASDWQKYTLDLTDTRFWVYLDSTAGMNNRFTQPVYMDSMQYFNFSYGANDGSGNRCMRLYWFGGSKAWGGVFLFPAEATWESKSGFNLSGITKIKFKAKISTPGKVKFLFGRAGDSCDKLTMTSSLTSNWQWYEFSLPSNLNYSNVTGGFGFYFGGDIGTPNYSYTYIDSVYYEGATLANDFSNLISGLKVSATKALNPSGATIYLDNIQYNKNKLSELRFCQSFICGSDTIDMTLKNRADVYDNALLLITNLQLYKKTQSPVFLNNAKHIGDGFVYASAHDRYFADGRLRNSYMCGDLIYYNGSTRLPGWMDTAANMWYEDVSCLSTSTGNIAWAGLALTSLYETTLDAAYLNCAKTLADWCITNTATNCGFTGGFSGSDTSQIKLKWKSTEHNIDLYALFTRLTTLTSSAAYNTAAQSAKNFVLSMWNSSDEYFWTGTKEDGVTPNTQAVPLDVQAWYIMSFKDFNSKYINGLAWAKEYCLQRNYKSPNYSDPITGFSFSNIKDGVWFEGTAQAALASKMIDNDKFADSLFTSIEYVQTHNAVPAYYNLNYKGIVAADHDNTKTGFDWDYHNRLHIAPTCWYIMAKLGENPYYSSAFIGTDKSTPARYDNLLYNNYPNPFNPSTTISFQLKETSEVTVNIYNSSGRIIRHLLKDTKEAGDHSIVWNGKNDKGTSVSSGIYIFNLTTNNGFHVAKQMSLIK